MDTIETNEPTVVDDVATPADTSANDTQPTETGKVNVTEPAEAGKQETLIAGKYKSQEELVKAHKELESKLGELGQKAKLTNTLEQRLGMSAQEIEAYIAQQEQAQMARQLAENPAAYALQEVQQLKSQLALKEVEAELDSVIRDNPEYAPYREKILNLGLNLENDKDFLDIANEYFGQARAQGQQDAYKKIEKKTQTQPTGVSSATPKSKLTAEEIEALPLKERIAYLEANFS